MCHYYYLEQFSSFTWPALSRFCFNMTSKYLLNPKNFKIKLPDEANSEFDRLIQDRWQDLMAKGHFRYDISSMKSRQVGKFVAQLNPMRATTRRKPESMLTVRQPFDHQKFNFTKAALDNELICDVVDIDKNDVKPTSTCRDVVIINVSPIEFGHCLLVPGLEECRPQVLTEHSIVLALKTMASSGRKNFKMAFNSLCAYASVNHLHWHLYYLQNHELYLETVEADPLTPECFEVKRSYPGHCFAFQVTAESEIGPVAASVFKLVDYLSLNDIAHNVFLTRGSRFDVGDKTSFDVIRIFVWARENVVGNKDPAAFVIAVCELSGQLLIYDRHKFESIAEDEIEVAMVETCGRVFEQIRPKVVKLFEKS